MRSAPGPSPDQSAHAHKLLNLITASWTAQVAYVAAELRLADLLADGPRSCPDLAAATKTHEPSLHRLLRAMTTIGLTEEELNQGITSRFRITPMGSLLAADNPSSLRSWTIWWGAHLWSTWGQLLYSIQTGQSARAHQTGTTGFGHLDHDQAAAATFNRALVELTRLSAPPILAACDFTRFRSIVDVGGGFGELLATILRAHPSIRGTLFDLPHALPGARQHLAAAGLADRCDFIAGDFFESVPPGADAYILKTVIHDWPDDTAARILRTCHRAMTTSTPKAIAPRLLIIDRILPDQLTPDHAALARSDLTMLIAHAGLERTLDQFRALLTRAGFQLLCTHPAGALSIIEAEPAATRLTSSSG